jgi:hypothetical protein
MKVSIYLWLGEAIVVNNGGGSAGASTIIDCNRNITIVDALPGEALELPYYRLESSLLTITMMRGKKLLILTAIEKPTCDKGFIARGFRYYLYPSPPALTTGAP